MVEFFNIEIKDYLSKARNELKLYQIRLLVCDSQD